MTARFARRVVPLVCAAGVLVACSDSGATDDASASGGDGATPPSVAVPEAPAPSAPGTGTVVIGGTATPFEVSECRLEPPAGSEADPFVPAVEVKGFGTTESGVPFTVDVVRFATGREVKTYTDTATYTDSARILQAMRVEVAGEVTDLRDPSAASALVRLRGDGLSLAGVAGAPGDTAAGEGVVGLAVDVTCP